VVAATTLAVVAHFQPARGGFKRWSTGASTAAATTPPGSSRGSGLGSTRLRDQVDLTTLTGELLAVVNQTMRPTWTSLWLRPEGAAGATDGTAAHGSSAGGERDAVTARSSGAIIAPCNTEGMTKPPRQLSEERQAMPLTCGFGAPGRIRTCTSRIRSRPTTVHANTQGAVLAGQVGWSVQLMRPRCAGSCVAE
jgi:hypothetical protein